MYKLDDRLKAGEVSHGDPIISRVDALLVRAIAVRASDIHCEPINNALRVRYRIDGVLYDQDPVSQEQRDYVLSRIKVLAALDVAERRLPQDGKLRTVLSDKRIIDFRVATFPSIYGEKIVIRVFDRSTQRVALESLGLSDELLSALSSMLRQPHGLFLTTGPTGAGKTTTLYALLNKINNAKRNIVTMEDPVEHHVDGVVQSQVHPKIGFTFENGLRSLVRQDPDVIMIGEIRDRATVTIALEAALTGHLVLSSLHTNDAVGAITRLRDMGVEPFLISAALQGVIAQRLVRLLCDMCKEERLLSKREQERVTAFGWSLTSTWTAQGCKNCLQTGFCGRIGIFELLVVSNELRDAIVACESAQKLRQRVEQGGMSTLMDDALLKVQTGKISLVELLLSGRLRSRL